MSVRTPTPVAADLCGRDDELAAVDDAVDALLAGDGGAVALSGDPGIGKTRLLAAWADRCRASGVRTHVRYGGETPLGPRLPPRPAGSDPRGGSGPVAVILDDLHARSAVDAQDLAELIRLSVTGPLLLVMAFRPRQLPSLPSGVVAHAAAAGRLDLRMLDPLDDVAARAVVHAVANGGRRPTGPAPDVDGVCAAADGIPLYLRILATGGDLTVGPGGVVLSELARLGRATRRAARLAAGLAEPFTSDRISGPKRGGSLGKALDELLTADFLRPADAASGLRFRHPVAAAVVRADGDAS